MNSNRCVYVEFPSWFNQNIVQQEYMEIKCNTQNINMIQDVIL